MITDIKKDEYGIEGKVKFNLFDAEIDVFMDDDVSIEYAEKCAEHMNNLSDDMIEKICESAKRYCLFMIEEWDLVGEWEEISEDMTIEVSEDTPARELLKAIYPTVLIIDSPEDTCCGYHIECACDWEPEHGLEITIRDDKVVYIGHFTDSSPWQEYDENNECNFVNSI